MARKFNFKSNFLNLDIAGEEFEIDVFQPDLTKRMDDHRKELLEQGEALTSLRENNASSEELEKELEKAINLCVGVVDDLLEEGATKRIFKNRKINFLDIVDVSNFVFEEIDSYITDDVSTKYLNRAQRRSKK